MARQNESMASYAQNLDNKYGFPLGTMETLVRTESNGKGDATSSKGARGYTQLMPSAMTDAGLHGVDPASLPYRQQLSIAAAHLNRGMEKFGDIGMALAGYNAGNGRMSAVRSGKTILPNETAKYLQKFSDAGIIPPDSEALQYAQSARRAGRHNYQQPDFSDVDNAISAIGDTSAWEAKRAQFSNQRAGRPTVSTWEERRAQFLAKNTGIEEQQPEIAQSNLNPEMNYFSSGQRASLSDNQPQSTSQQIGNGLAETGRGLLQGAIKVGNIPAAITDAVVGAGAGIGQLLGMGDGTYPTAPRVTTQGLEQDFGLQPGTLTPQSTEGKIFSEVLPYLTPVGAERLASQSPNLIARAAQAIPRLTAENVTGALAANSGTDASPNGFAADLALGVGAGGVINAAAKGIGSAAKSVGGRYVKAAGDRLRDVVTQGVQPSTLETTARAVSEAPDTSILRRNVNVSNAAGDADNITPQTYRAAEEVRPNQSVLDAAKRLGVDEQLIPSHFSNNPTYRAIEQGLKSVPASQLAAQEHAAITTLAQKADDLIESAGGMQSRTALSDKFRTESTKAIDKLASSSDKIYGEISAAIPSRTLANANSTVSLLRSKAGDLGGAENLSAAEKMVLKRLSGKVVNNADGTTSTIPPTYALLDNTRKQIGAAIGKNEGPFKDQTTAELSSLYEAITRDQKVVADSLGMGSKWDVAKGLVSQRKELEEKMAYALGKDLTGTFTSKLTPAIQNLRKGNSQSFQKLISATPASMRQEVVASALNDAFTLGSRKEAQLNIPGFVDWYAGAKRNGVLAQVTKHLPDDAAKRLNDLYIVANGIRTAKSSEISTGRIQALLDQFDKSGGMVSRVYNIGKKAAAAEGFTSAIGVPGVGAASIIASSLTAKKTARTIAADQLIASHQFRNAARIMAGADSIRLANAREGVERALTRSRQYQRWAATLQPAERQAIAKVGLLNWLKGDSEE